MIAAQIEEPVFQPDFFRIILLAENRHRQFGGGAKHLDLIDVDFDLTSRQIGILGAGGALAHLAVNAHDPFRAQRLGELECLAIGVGHDLREPIVVPQVYEQNATMITDAMAPAREPHGHTDIAFAKRAAGM